MPRKKKTETINISKEELEKMLNEKMPDEKSIDYGTGYARINNMLQAGYSLKDIMEEKKNE